MIKVVDDVVAPLAVAGVDQATKKWWVEGNEWVTYGMTALGYLGAGFNYGGDFVKNVAIASVPLSVQQLMTRFGTVARVAPSVAHFKSNVKTPVTRMSSSRKEFANSQIG